MLQSRALRRQRGAERRLLRLDHCTCRLWASGAGVLTEVQLQYSCRVSARCSLAQHCLRGRQRVMHRILLSGRSAKGSHGGQVGQASSHSGMHHAACWVGAGRIMRWKGALWTGDSTLVAAPHRALSGGLPSSGAARLLRRRRPATRPRVHGAAAAACSPAPSSARCARQCT